MTDSYTFNLYDQYGTRLYLNAVERAPFLLAAEQADPPAQTLALTLHYTGCRISEALQLTVGRVDASEAVLVFESLKKRKRGIFRAVPVPHHLLNTLHKQLFPECDWSQLQPDRRLWPYHRMTAWRWIKDIMAEARIEGAQANPKGLRHGFGVAAIQAGVPINILQKWLGHEDLATTAIYANAVGQDQRVFAEQMWAKWDEKFKTDNRNIA